MDWGNYENHVAVIALHKVGSSLREIFKMLHKLKISKRFVYCTIQHFLETGTVKYRPGKDDHAQYGLQN